MDKLARPITVSVGPLAASGATKVCLSQKAANSGGQFLVLNGADGVATANNICLSQSPSGAGNLTLNGSTTSGSPAVAYLGSNLYVYITSSGDDSGNTFTITGTAMVAGGGYVGVSEAITGSASSVVSSANKYYSISTIAISGASGGTVTVGSYGVATLDAARQILFTDGSNDASITFTIKGTDWAGSPITEAVTGSNGATAVSVLSYLTISSIKTSAAVATTISVGTNGVAYSPWVRFDEYSAMGPTAIQCNPSTAGANFTVQQTLDDPNSPTNPVLPQNMTWINHPDSALVAATTAVQGNYAYPPLYARVLLNSGSGAATATFLQNYQR